MLYLFSFNRMVYPLNAKLLNFIDPQNVFI